MPDYPATVLFGCFIEQKYTKVTLNDISDNIIHHISN